MHQPKIARILTRPGVGGAAKHVAQISRGLRDEFDSRLFLGPARRGEGDFFTVFPEFETPKTQISTLRREVSFGHDLRALRDLVRHFRAWRPDLVDTHLSKAGILGRIAARICGIPAVHTFHINIFEGYNWPPHERELFLRLERACARFSARLLCLSDELGAQFLAAKIGEPSQFRTVTLGVDLTPFEADETPARKSVRTELNLDENAILIGQISRLAPVKNAKATLEAAKILENQFPNAHFVFVGDGESRARLEQLAGELGLQNRAHFLGIRADIARLNLAFDCVVLPSFQEGTPVSIIESLGAARPVIASNVGGVSRLISHEKTGFLLEIPDAKNLANAISRVLNESETARKCGESGRESVRKSWSLRANLGRHREIYREVLGEK